MLVPYNTDAPIYHLPIATVTIILINIAVFFATTAGAGTIEEFEAHRHLMLESGKVFQIVPFFFTGVRLSSELLHLTGLVVGLPVAVVMLRRRWVDCEGWDLFSVWRGDHAKLIGERRQDSIDFVKKQKTRKKRKNAATASAQSQPASTELAARVLDDAIRQGNLAVAAAIYKKLSAQDARFKISSSQLAAWIQALHQRNRWSESVPLMVKLISQSPGNTHGARIKLAQILVQVEKKPKQALRVQRGLPKDLQGDFQRTRAVAALAKQQVK